MHREKLLMKRAKRHLLEVQVGRGRLSIVFGICGLLAFVLGSLALVFTGELRFASLVVTGSTAVGMALFGRRRPLARDDDQLEHS
jgi:hypothetical protein